MSLGVSKPGGIEIDWGM